MGIEEQQKESITGLEKLEGQKEGKQEKYEEVKKRETREQQERLKRDSVKVSYLQKIYDGCEQGH